MADARPCWVVRGQESVPGQSAPQDKAASILCKGRHAKRKLLTLQVRADPGNAKAADGCRGFVGGNGGFREAGRALCGLTAGLGGVAELRCCTGHVDVDADVDVDDES